MVRFSLALATVSLGFVTVFSPIVTPASAAVVTVCTRPGIVAMPAAQIVQAPQLALATTDEQHQSPTGDVSQVILQHDAKGFDLVLMGQDAREHSLREAGVDIFDTSLGSDLIHLMADGPAGSVEHFLFTLDEEGSGELLWGIGSGGPDSVTRRSLCTGPR